MVKHSKTKDAPFRKVSFGKIDVEKTIRDDGAVLLTSKVPLQSYPERFTDRLVHWARERPDNIFIAQRNKAGAWDCYTYAQTLYRVRKIAQWLLAKDVSADRPVAILSENSVDHAMLALAAMHAGIPYSPVSPLYSLKSTDFTRLRHVIDLLSPGLIFAADGKKYERALQAVSNCIDVLVVENPSPDIPVTLLAEVAETGATSAVEDAYRRVTCDTIAKILFTSGSTGLPKGVINTHGNICVNLQQITQTFPFMADEFEILDWLPWNHTFGGNHNFGLTLYNGGSMYLDDGDPTPSGIGATVRNLREISPTIYFNVPKGFEELVPYLRADKDLREKFFSRVKMLFYAGAGMPQHVWDALDELAIETVGEKIVIGTGLGCTESSPSALFANKEDGFSGLLGVPVPGLQLKLVRVNEKMEARYHGPNITPGYWRQPALTANAFDVERSYRTGDALKFVDSDDPNAGMLFDGRIDENFKLNTGTWVSVGTLRTQLIHSGNGLIQDAVITGHDEDFVGAIVFPEANYCRKIAGLEDGVPLSDLVRHAAMRQALGETLGRMARKSTGSSTFIRRAVFADFQLSMDAGEITVKGTINQQAVLKNYGDLVKSLYLGNPSSLIVEIKPKNGEHL